MQIKREQKNPTTVNLHLVADQAQLENVKEQVLRRLGKNMKVAGFRPGKAPLSMIERQVNGGVFHDEFIDAAANRLFGEAIEKEKLRPVRPPKVDIKKFVPFTDLELTADVEVIGDIALSDYKKVKLTKKQITITDKDVDTVIENVRRQLATKKGVERPAKEGDEVVIDFTGTDTKTKEPVSGAKAKDYSLLLGSNTFIPGFEENVIGMKPGEAKTFTLTFPKDYGIKALQDRKVKFDVTMKKVSELEKPAVDDAFASKVGPFKKVTELKEDIRQQLASEKQREADEQFENELLEKVTDSSQVALPTVLIDEEVERMTQQIRQNLLYRGRTWQEFLENEGRTEEGYRSSLRGQAERRVKAGIVLSEIAEKENITVTPEEFNVRLRALKAQYKDPTMQAELEKPATARSIISGMLSEKTLLKLVEYASAK